MPRKNKEYSCPLCDVNSETGEVEKIERIVMDWAAENPEPRYPTWKEWQDATFPDALCDMCPRVFGVAPMDGCVNVSCDDCMRAHIPADIAKKLGVKPIGGTDDENA
jgi:hypothetical protein